LVFNNRFNLTNEQARDGLLHYSLQNTDLKRFCFREPVCEYSKYRTIDGSCNNLRKPLWAKSNTAFSRLVPPAYADGINKPRISVTGGQLPSARVVSVAAATDRNITDKKFTLFVMQWGQVCHSLFKALISKLLNEYLLINR
jgi:peroxidase